MDWFSTLAIAVYVCADVALVAKTMLVIYRQSLCSKSIAIAARLFRSVRVQFVRDTRRGDDPVDDQKQTETRHIHERAKKELVERCVLLARYVNVGIAVLIVLDRPTVYSDGLHKQRVGRAVTHMVMSLVSVGCCCVPAALNSRTLVCWNIVLMACICVSATPWSTEVVQGLAYGRANLHMLAVGLSFLCPRLIVLVATNACLAACVVWLYASNDESLEGLEGLDVSTLIRGEAWILAVKTMVHWRVYVTLQEVAEQEIRSKMGQCERSAVSSLLGMMCDAVVDLDANLRMLAHEASLSTLLMHGNGRSSKGVAIRELVPPGHEREIFDESIARNVRGLEGSPTPGMFGTRIRDSIGNLLKVVIYHVPYETVTGSVHHLLGLREDSDPLAIKGAVRDGRGAEPPEAVLADAVAEELSRSHRVSRCSDDPAVSSEAGSSASSVRSVPGEHTLTADVVIEEGLPFRYVTENLRSKLGLNPGAEHFLDVVPVSEREAFFQWVRDRAEQVRAGAASAPRIEVYGDLNLVSAGGQSSEGGHRKVRVCFPASLIPVGGDNSVSINLGRLRRRAPACPAGSGTPGCVASRGSLSGPACGDQPSCSKLGL